jgi:hypothetical protein
MKNFRITKELLGSAMNIGGHMSQEIINLLQVVTVARNQPFS